MPANAIARPAPPSVHAGLSVPVRGPLHAAWTLDRYRRHGEDPASRLVQGALYRAAREPGRLVPYRVTVGGGVEHPRVSVAFEGPGTSAVRARLRRETTALLGLDADLQGFRTMAARDRILAPLLRPAAGLWGLRPSATPDPLELLVGLIAAQQINLRFAFRVRARLVEALGEPAMLDGVRVLAFPTAERLAATDPSALRLMQFSTGKAEAIVGLARAVADGRLDLPGLRDLPDDEVIDRLTRLRGLGRWSAEWFLARGLGRPDVCPAGDLGVRRAMEALCFGGAAIDAAATRRRAEAWRPFRSIAVHYLLAAHRVVTGAGPRQSGR